MKRVLVLIQQHLPFVVFHVFYKLFMQVSYLIIHTLCALACDVYQVVFVALFNNFYCLVVRRGMSNEKV